MPPRLAAMAGGSSSQLGSSIYRSSEAVAASRGDTEMDGSSGSNLEEVDVDTLYLQPPAYTWKEKRKWQESGHTIGFGLDPVDGSVASWITHRSTPETSKASSSRIAPLPLVDQLVSFSSLSNISQPLATLFTESHTLFTSLQHIVASASREPIHGQGLNARGLGVAEVWNKKGEQTSMEGLLGPPGAETVGHIRRLVGMYLEEVVKLRESDVEPEVKARFDAVYHVLNLAMILYLPQDGRGEGLLGEELLDWVNDVDPAPDNSQGNEIMQTNQPWDHPSFWPYVARCILRGFHLPASSFMRTLTDHPHAPISKLAAILHHHLSVYPRSHQTSQFPLESQFVSAHRAWLSRLRAEVSAFLGGRAKGSWLEEKSGGGKEWRRWEDGFRVVIDLMEGKSEAVLEQAADWREAVGAWGVLVDVQLKRDDLPAALARIIANLPVDPSVLDDSIESNLCKGNIIQAMTGCQELDVWLAAHLGDVFDKLALIPDDEERFEMSLRDYFLLEYTDVLQTSPQAQSFWRVICDYLAAAGDEGGRRLSSHILHISLNLDAPKAPAPRQAAEGELMEVEEPPVDENLRHFTEVREACSELRLEKEWKTMSKIVAERLIRKGEYGVAATMCLQAEDSFTLSLIAERICDAYLVKGDAEFLRLVETLPASLLNGASQALSQEQQDGVKALDLPSQSARSVFASRLTFLAEFRDYLLFLSQGARDRAAIRLVDLLKSMVAPVGMWAVLLAESVNLLEDPDILFTSTDSFEILRILDEVTQNSSYASEEYLYSLIIYLRRDESPESATTIQTVETITKAGLAEAHRKLDQVRLAVARNLARSLVVGFDNPF